MKVFIVCGSFFPGQTSILDAPEAIDSLQLILQKSRTFHANLHMRSSADTLTSLLPPKTMTDCPRLEIFAFRAFSHEVCGPRHLDTLHAPKLSTLHLEHSIGAFFTSISSQSLGHLEHLETEGQSDLIFSMGHCVSLSSLIWRHRPVHSKQLTFNPVPITLTKLRDLEFSFSDCETTVVLDNMHFPNLEEQVLKTRSVLRLSQTIY
ncbi:hypothetical protein M422DRAFT_242660 [Sphaerobolus stellatus SS14]|nr:hypothetical protein M422DRAFT_242660 [Sphaerobolus stellatus SS14]